MRTRHALTALALVLGVMGASSASQAQTYVAPGGNQAWPGSDGYGPRPAPNAVVVPDIPTTGAVARDRTPAAAWDGVGRDRGAVHRPAR